MPATNLAHSTPKTQISNVRTNKTNNTNPRGGQPCPLPSKLTRRTDGGAAACGQRTGWPGRPRCDVSVWRGERRAVLFPFLACSFRFPCFRPFFPQLLALFHLPLSFYLLSSCILSVCLYPVDRHVHLPSFLPPFPSFLPYFLLSFSCPQLS